MKLYALYGTSGTGKSTIALQLAHQLNIDAIIDDGILVHQGRKVAGISAKYEKTKIQAVKRAIFYYKEHAKEVQVALQEHSFDTLLILGTSKKMIHRIANALQLTDPIEFIPIEDLKTPAEMDAARYMRESHGRHVIPVPRVEVEKDFFQKIISHAQQILSPKKEVLGETTVVHPSFSGGRIQIHEQVLRKIVQITCQRFEQVNRIHKTIHTFHDLPRLTVHLSLTVVMGEDIPLIVEQIQQALLEETSYCLNISPASIDIHVVSLELAQ